MNQPIQAILSAARFAAEKHANQKRKGRAAEPYINHLIEVAELLANSSGELDTNLVIAGFLHDTIEDAKVPKTELVERFGDDVADLVAEVSDDKNLESAERKRLQIENAPRKSVRAQALGTADKISNLRSILSSPPLDWNSQRQQDYFGWAKQVVDGYPAANEVLKLEFEKVYGAFQAFVRLKSRNIEEDTRILSERQIFVIGIPILLERWSADGVRGSTAVLLPEHVAGMDDSAIQKFLTELAGLDLDGGVTITRRETHAFVNYSFEAK